MNELKVAPPFSKFKQKTFLQYAKVGQFIYYLGESPLLRQTSKEVNSKNITSSKFKEKIDYLKKCLLKYRQITRMGRGITAVQVGIPERFAIIYTPKKLLLIINPKITKVSANKLLYPEMCMSCVPVIAPVIRPAWVEFEYYDENGKPRKWNKKDNSKQNRILNRVFQHEIDHMNGILNIQLVKNPKDLLLHTNPKFYKNAKFIEV